MTPCEKCGASVRIIVERVFGFVATRALCSAGHSRHLGIVSLLPPERPILPRVRRADPPVRPVRTCPCGVVFLPRSSGQKYHETLCERRHRDRRRRLADAAMRTP